MCPFNVVTLKGGNSRHGPRILIMLILGLHIDLDQLKKQSNTIIHASDNMRNNRLFSSFLLGSIPSLYHIDARATLSS